MPKPRILVLSSRLPFPLVGGDKIRMYYTAKELSSDFDIDLLALHEGVIGDGIIEELKKVYNEVFIFSFPKLKYFQNAVKGLIQKDSLQVSYYYFHRVQAWLANTIKLYDGVFVYHIRMASYVRHFPGLKWIDLVDAISLNYQIAIEKRKGIWNLIYRYEQKKVLIHELRAINGFDKSFLVSQRDKNFLVSKGVDSEKIIVAPAGVSKDLLERRFSESEEDQICFLGKMDTVANEDAVVYFAQEIFPILKKMNPLIRFIIVGAKPTKPVLQLQHFEGVKVTGFVDDPYQILSRSKVVVAPMRIGAGMQNKVLEAMAIGKTVVLSSLASDGIGGVNGKHYVVADKPQEIVESIFSLMNDEMKRKSVGNEARKWISDFHTWDSIGKIFKDELGNSLKKSRIN